MKKTFGSRLFRFFLLFSLTPALILTAVGYYLTMETGKIEQESDHHLNTEIAKYYNELIYSEIDDYIADYNSGKPLPEQAPDFMFGEFENDIEEVRTPEGLTPPVMKSIVEAAVERQQGFVSQKGSYFQFCSAAGNDGRRIYAGVVHDRSYGELLALIQSDLAQQSSSRILKPEYVFFLSMVFVVLSGITVVLAYYFSARLSRSMSRPLSELSTASRMIAGGDFRQRVKPAGETEIRTLIENFNGMAAQLDQTTARLAQTERVAAWRQVARRFAHELKNPIQPILISLYRIEKLLIDTDAYDKIYEPLKAASDELKHLTTLAERFSTLAKLPEPSLKSTDINDLVQSVVSLYEEQLGAYGFVYDPPSIRISAVVDPDYLREALHNIIQNAVDASSRGSRIILSLARTQNTIDISLQDFGEGMDSETAASARLPYFTTKEKGNGLGLAIVEKSISEMGGRLQVDSQKGHGTTVTLSLSSREQTDAVENTDS